MKNILFFAHGAHSNTKLYIPFLILALLIPALSHGSVEIFGLDAELHLPIILFDLFALKLLVGYLSPQHFELVKVYEDEYVKVRGKFEGGNIRLGKELNLKSVSKNCNTIDFIVNDNGTDRVYTISDKYFPSGLLDSIAEISIDLKTLTPENIKDKYCKVLSDLKIHDSRKSMLLRMVEQPSFMKISWFCLIAVLTANYLILNTVT